MAAEILLSVK